MAANTRIPPGESRETTTSGSGRDRPDAGAREGLGGWIRDRVSKELTSRKNRVSDRLDGVAERVRRIGEPRASEPLPRVSAIADDAARRIEQVAEGLRERDLGELADDVRGFARNRPAAFIGAGLAAGLIAGRFLRSSSGPSMESGKQPGDTPPDQGSQRPAAAGRTRRHA
jgi:hypothetical protein